MKLTSRDLVTISQLRRFQRRWHWVRWLVLFCGLLAAAFFVFDARALFFLVSHTDQLHPTAAEAWHLAELVPLCLIFVFITTAVLARALVYWSGGNPIFALLLSLVDEDSERK